MSSICLSKKVTGSSPTAPRRRGHRPELVSAPLVSGTGLEGSLLSADQSDSWKVGGQLITVALREYRLLVGGDVVAGAADDPTRTLPQGSGGQSYVFEMRAASDSTPVQFSSWTEIASGSVGYAAPQAVGTLADVALMQGDPAYTLDLAPAFTGTDLSYGPATGSLPAGLALDGSLLTLATDAVLGPETVTLRASNPGGHADQSLTVSVGAAASVPAAFAAGDWSLQAVAVAGAIDLEISALPDDGGSAISALEIAVNGGGYAPLSRNGLGSYRIDGFGTAQSLNITLRAVNAVGAGPASPAQSVTTLDVPQAFGTDDWSLSDPGTGNDIRLTISALPGDGGSALTQLEAQIDGGPWITLTTAPAPGDFDLQDLFAPGESAQIAIRAGNAIGAGPASAAKTITPSMDFQITSTVDGELEINGIDGTITLTVTSPAVYAAYDAGQGPGVFTTSLGALDAGPVALVPPQIGVLTQAGADLAPGDVLEVTPGLWLYDGENAAPDITHQWLRSGVSISGATSTSYTLTVQDEGRTITVDEAASDTNGMRAAVSAPLAIAGTGAIESVSGQTGGLVVDYAGTANISATTGAITVEAI